MVDADLREFTVAQHVDAGIAEVHHEPVGLGFVKRKCNHRHGRACTTPRVIVEACNALIGADHGVGDVLELYVVSTGERGELIRDDSACDFAGIVAAHTVGDEKNRVVGDERILVDGTHETNVGCARRGHTEISPVPFGTQ